ncbi:Dpy-30 motif containing protein, putative [Angomonas deanei]|uniref:Dpy-30 motif containing protein, putative n=1 Tax=Angomonas deanei TaxID=59799 RepID=A0A7G2CRX1_9TRYP|nr:Dpy-30 motif containing protein, putative [Angomonas deanei]
MSQPNKVSGVLLPAAARSVTEDGGDLLDEEILRLQSHLTHPPRPPPPVAAHLLPDQDYLEQTVIPLVLRGMEEVGKVRPPDPLAFLGAYLLSNNPQRDLSLMQVSGEESGLTAPPTTSGNNTNAAASGETEGDHHTHSANARRHLLQNSDNKKVDPTTIPDKAAKYFYGEKEPQDVAEIPKKK